MPKQHELLAVFDNIKKQLTVVLKAQIAAFTSKPQLFMEYRRELYWLEEGKPKDQLEFLEIQSTVIEELTHIRKSQAKRIDIGYQIDVVNTRAFADIVSEDGVVLAEHVPATFLMQMAHVLKEHQEFLKTIKTLDPAKSFKLDPDRGRGIYKAREVRKPTTKKTDTPVVLYPATKEHPAKVELKSYDVVIGHTLEQEWSGLITPAKKAELLDRSDQLLRAVMQAKAVANSQDVPDIKELRVANKLLNFLYDPLLNLDDAA